MKNKIFNFLKKEKENLVHFYTLIGDNKKNEAEVILFLKECLNFNIKNNLDFFNFDCDLINIEIAREIKKKNSYKAFGKTYKIFFIKGNNINQEAQNALLKTVEEPNNKTIFFLFLNQKKNILDTILSRTKIIESNLENKNLIDKTFLKLSFKEKEKFLLKISKENYIKLIDEIDLLLIENKSYFKKEKEDFLNKYNKFLELKKQAYINSVDRKNILVFVFLLFNKNF